MLKDQMHVICHCLVRFVYISIFSSTTQIHFHTVIHCKATYLYYLDHSPHSVSKEWISHLQDQATNKAE
jgi:hypothetical protein